MENTTENTTGAGDLRALQSKLGSILLPPRGAKPRATYKGWKSGMRSAGWVEVDNGTKVSDLGWHIQEVKTVGPVTMERHQKPRLHKRDGGGLWWVVNGQRFDKLRDAVAHADSLMP